ncbi:helix-turn-helix domain-containing protein [Polaromonas sp.]|uniref:helix-turn-helix domain-containing protein n=1 Tax=Polaromonas sp. TaxID=1869339 RepID=UPI0025DFA37C|nr:helix-turn-helix domain-containing protein [Polaromonas sp.]
MLGLIDQACADGARRDVACSQVGLSCRSVQRWQRTDAAAGDQRPSGKRRYVCPPNKLREEERQAVMATLNSEPFKDLPPSQIVPRLADTGVYVASESTMYRLLRQEGQLAHRRSERAAHKRSRPRALAATGPDQVFCWDTQSTR